MEIGLIEQYFDVPREVVYDERGHELRISSEAGRDCKRLGKWNNAEI